MSSAKLLISIAIIIVERLKDNKMLILPNLYKLVTQTMFKKANDCNENDSMKKTNTRI